MNKCTNCHSDVEKDALFCTSCGQQLPKQKECIKCGISIDEDCDWCTHCGAKQVIENEKMDKKSTTRIKVSHKKKIIIPLLLIVSIIGIGSGIFYYIKKQPPIEEVCLNADSIHTADSLAAIEAFRAELAEQARQAELTEQAKQVEPTEQTTNTSSQIVYKGSINHKYGIVMSLQIDNGNVTGSYYYSKNGSNYPLTVYGKINSDNELCLEEYNAQNERTGTFNGNYDSDKYDGTFVNYKGEEMTFELSRAN